MEKEFQKLRAEADSILKDDTVHESVVLVKTAKGNVYHMFQSLSSYDPMLDIAFMDMLVEKDDAQVRYIAALLNPDVCELLDPDVAYSLSPPGWCLRRGLLDLAPGNEEAQVYLCGGSFCNSRSLADIQPGQKGLDAEKEKIRRLRSERGE